MMLLLPSSPAAVFARFKTCARVAALAIFAAALAVSTHAGAQCSSSPCSGSGISVVGGTISTPTSTVSVSAAGAVQTVYVELDGVYSNGGDQAPNGGYYVSLSYSEFTLTSPTGQKFDFLAGTGDGCDGTDNCEPGTGVHNATITVEDAAAKQAPGINDLNGYSYLTTTSWTVKPSSYYLAWPQGNPPLPSGGSSGEWASTDGSGTFANIFSGVQLSGTWTLTLTDNNPYTVGDPVSITGWKLYFVASALTETTTSISSSVNPSFTNGTNAATTLTATVTSSGSPVTTGTVAFTNNGAAISGCGSQPVSGGQATCTTAIITEGIHSVGATYSGTSTYETSSSSTLNQFVKNHTTLAGGEYCNTGSLTVNAGTIDPYPSVVNVGTDTTALTGTVASVTVSLKGLAASAGLFPGYGFMLVAPDRSQAYDLDFLSSVGSSGGQSPVNLTFADGNSSAPEDGPLTSGTYEATDLSYTADSFNAATSPAPQVPGTVNYAQPDLFGNNPQTFESAFSGANGNGDWALFAYNSGGGVLSVDNGWCISITQNSGAVTNTALASSANSSTTGANLTLVATVTSSGSPVTSGTVTFTENGAVPAGVSPNVVALNGSGQASISTTGLAEGDHHITAAYSGVTNTYDPSETTLWQRIDNASTISGLGTSVSPLLVCNAGAITLPGGAAPANIGAATPNPSNVFVAHAPGTLQSMEVQLMGFHSPQTASINTSSLLVGPNGTGFDFFSGTGDSSTTLGTGNYYFADSAGAVAPASQFFAGTYLPTSYNAVDTFFPNASGIYTLPGSYDYGAEHSNPFSFNGSSNGAFYDINPNGAWSLYFNQNIHEDVLAGATEWCVSLVENLPAASVTASHNGNISAGESNAQLTVSITNDGPGSTGDPTTTNPMTVTDVLNSALTYSGASGSGWTCSASGQSVTCTDDNPVAQSSSYPELTINVNVSSSASGPVSNTVSIAGAGVSSTNSNTDNFTIDVAPQITSPGSTTFSVGSFGTFAVTTTGTPTASLSESGPLPSGVTFTDNGGGNATLAGTPAASTGGSYPITITAQNGTTPNATQNFTLTVTSAPTITSANSTTFTAATAGSFTITTAGNPKPSLSESGPLPSGVGFTDNGNGTATLAGPPASVGSFPIVITANNGVSPQATQSFTLTVNPVLSTITSPTNGSTLPSGAVTFGWSFVPGVQAYQIVAGTWGPGAADIYDSYMIAPTATSKTVTLPSGGVTLFVRFIQEINGAWYSTDTTYTESGTTVPAVISSPAPGSVLTTTTPTFSWAGANGPDEFSLAVGTSGVGVSDIYYSGAIFHSTSQQVTIPANGQKILVRLSQLYNGTWSNATYTYIEPATPAVVNSPLPNSTLTGASVTFDWSGGKGPTDYQVLIGTTRPGSGNILNTLSTHTTSATVTVPTDGATVFVRLNQEINGAWQSTDYTYTEFGTLQPAVISSPVANSVLPSINVTFDWSGAPAPIEYTLSVGTTGPGSTDVYSSGGITATSANVTVPYNGTTVYVRLWQLLNAVWRSTDYTYTEPTSPCSVRPRGVRPQDAKKIKPDC